MPTGTAEKDTNTDGETGRQTKGWRDGQTNRLAE